VPKPAAGHVVVLHLYYQLRFERHPFGRPFGAPTAGAPRGGGRLHRRKGVLERQTHSSRSSRKRPLLSSSGRHRSPSRFTRCTTLSIRKSLIRKPSLTSFQVTGVETLASTVGLTEGDGLGDLPDFLLQRTAHDEDVDVDAGSPAGLGERPHAQPLERFPHHERRLQHSREARAFSRIEIEVEIVGTVLAGLDPLRPRTGRPLHEEEVAVDPVRVALHHHGPVLEMQQQERGDVGVIAKQVALGEALLGEEHLVDW